MNAQFGSTIHIFGYTKHTMRIVARLFLALAATVLSICGSYWIVEHYYFDKFFFQKSTVFGYWHRPDDDKITFASFGNRAKDIAYLDHFANNELFPIPNRVLGTTHEGKRAHTIVTIGDSYVWGQGIKNQYRFPVLLETRLNRIAPTKIISLARQGDGLFDNYMKYELARYAYPDADLFIIGVVDNDVILLGGRNSYNENFLQSLIHTCGDLPLLYFQEEPALPEEEYYKASYANYCVFQKTIQMLPKSNAIYFDFASKYFSQFEFSEQMILEDMRRAGLPIVSAKQAIERAANGNYETLHVSRLDSHPNAQANKIFSDVLYEYITASAGLYTK